MINLGYKFNVKFRPCIVKVAFLLLLTIVFAPLLLNAQSTKAKKAKNSISVPILKDTSTKIKDTIRPVDSTNIQTLRMSKDSLDGIVDYNAADSGVMIMKTKEFFLYGNAKTIYKASQLEAANIIFDQQSQNIRAFLQSFVIWCSFEEV